MTIDNIVSLGRRNPDFREDWQAVHDDAHARRETAFTAKQALIYRLPAISEAERESIRVFNEEWEEAHSLCMRCLDVYQHRTFEDALAWINRTFCSDTPVRIANIGEYDDIRQLIHAAYRIYRKPRKMATIQKYCIALASPETFGLFADADKCTYFRITIPKTRTGFLSDIELLFIADNVEGELHVAMQSNGRSISVINGSEWFIEEFLSREIPEWSAKSWFRRRKLPKITFYTYMPPSEFHTEMFDRVELETPLTPGKRISVAGWPSVGCVPATIRPKWLPGGLADWNSFIDDDVE